MSGWRWKTEDIGERIYKRVWKENCPGKCESFGEGGEGYIPGEGVGVVLLKRLEDAERDGDQIYGVIKGSTLNHGGKTNGYTVPNPNAQQTAIESALKEAKVDASAVSYI